MLGFRVRVKVSVRVRVRVRSRVRVRVRVRVRGLDLVEMSLKSTIDEGSVHQFYLALGVRVGV